MANPLARVMMDQMSKKSGIIKTEDPSESLESVSNINTREEAIITSVIHNTHKTLDGTTTSAAANYQGKKMQLQDLVKNTSEKEEERIEKPLQNRKNEIEKDPNQPVKNPYNKGEVKSSVVANPGKGVSAVSLKSLGKGNPL